ncbi:MAG: DUF47 family protein [Opitutaceae bacterium]|nr:DUF47 family protein [Opitutaceae bacterium]
MSLRKLLGKDEKFFDLLEASAEEAKSSTALLAKYLATVTDAAQRQRLDEFVLSRRKDKRITSQITEELCKTFVTPLEREDIEALSLALYRIPKGVEKVVERLSIYPGRIPHEHLNRQVALIEQAADAVIFMVKQLRHGTRLDKIQDANARLQHAEGEADKIMLEFMKELYHGPYEPREFVVLRELYEMLEKVIDRCRDAGNVVFQIVLKYS